MKKVSIIAVLTFLSAVFASCEKDNNEKEPDSPNATSWTLCITSVSAKVELEAETENDRELIEQIENEVKVKMSLLGDNFTFTPENVRPFSGKLVRSFNETQNTITTHYSFEEEEDNQYLKIIEKNVVTDILQFSPKNAPFYLIKDFTKDYNQSNNRIVSILGAAKYTIPK